MRRERLTVVSVSRKVALGDVLALVVGLLCEPRLGAARGGPLDGLARVAVGEVLALPGAGLVGRMLQAVVVLGELLRPRHRVYRQLLVPDQLAKPLGAASLVVQLQRVLLVLGPGAGGEFDESVRGGGLALDEGCG